MFKYLILLILIVAISCNTEKVKKTKIDREFTARFKLSANGLTGADGTYSILLPDSSTIWVFGDTFLGTVTPELTREKTNPLYIRNCFVLDDGKSLKTLHQGEPSEFKSMLIPPKVTKSEFEITEQQYWYWPGDGWVEGNKLKVFASEFHKTGDGMWDFEFKNTALFTFSLPDFKELSNESVTYSNTLGIHYGHSVCKTEDYVYVYGLLDKSPHVAKIDKDGKWHFFNGDGDAWSNNPADSKPMIMVNGSEQFSVFKHEEKFIMIMQAGELSDKIFSYTADTPYGSWGNKQLLYKTPMPYKNDQLFTYNALAHPQFTKNNELLISYNTNSFKLNDHFNNAGIYRPRFIRVPFEIIVK